MSWRNPNSKQRYKNKKEKQLKYGRKSNHRNYYKNLRRENCE